MILVQRCYKAKTLQKVFLFVLERLILLAQQERGNAYCYFVELTELEYFRLFDGNS